MPAVVRNRSVPNIIVSAADYERLTDLATGWGGNHLKVGSITRSERLAKWNRLLAIAAETGLPLHR